MAISWEIGAAVAEIVSALGVIASLVYLAYQIGQTNRIARSSAVSDLQQKLTEFFTVIVVNDKVAELIAKLVDSSYAQKTEAENQQVEMFATIVVGMWFSAQTSYSQEQIDEEAYRVYCDDVIARLVQWPALRPYYLKVLARYPSAKDHAIFAPI